MHVISKLIVDFGKMPALQADRGWAAALFAAGVVTIFVGFLVHMANMNLGAVQEPAGRAKECPWKLGAMVAVATVIIALGFWIPAPIYQLVEQSTDILRGAL